MFLPTQFLSISSVITNQTNSQPIPLLLKIWLLRHNLAPISLVKHAG